MSNSTSKTSCENRTVRIKSPHEPETWEPMINLGLTLIGDLVELKRGNLDPQDFIKNHTAYNQQIRDWLFDWEELTDSQFSLKLALHYLCNWMEGSLATMADGQLKDSAGQEFKGTVEEYSDFLLDYLKGVRRLYLAVQYQGPFISWDEFLTALNKLMGG